MHLPSHTKCLISTNVFLRKDLIEMKLYYILKMSIERGGKKII